MSLQNITAMQMRQLIASGVTIPHQNHQRLENDEGRENGVYNCFGDGPAGGPSVMIANAETIDPMQGDNAVIGESFCDCFYGEPNSGTSKVTCDCGEDEKYFEWLWDKKQHSYAAQIKEEQKEVCFHTEYSSGTAAVRGNQPFCSHQHYWEIKMTSPVFGTDMMVGVGTDRVNVNLHRGAFVSFLGEDADSWGLSYSGKLYHKGRFTRYGPRFGQGSIIGIHLDTWNGTLTFYKNRKCLGMAYSGLQGKVLYPMVCSTAARSAMKVIKSKSFKTSLQYLCCKRLRTLIPEDQHVLDAISLPPGLKSFLELNLDWLLVPHINYVDSSEPKENQRKRKKCAFSQGDDEVACKIIRLS